MNSLEVNFQLSLQQLREAFDFSFPNDGDNGNDSRNGLDSFKKKFFITFQKEKKIRSPFPVYYHTLYTHYGGGGGGGGVSWWTIMRWKFMSGPQCRYDARGG